MALETDTGDAEAPRPLPSDGDGAGTAPARSLADGERRDKILADAEAFFRGASSHTSKWRRYAREDFDFVAGKQWTDDERAELNEQLRPVITFNRIAPITDAVSGSEIQGRQEVRFI